MKIFVKVKPRAKENKVEKIDDSNFTVFVKEAPIKGKANEAIIESLAEYFNVAKSDVEIIRGHKSKDKIIEINK
jgi:uncharacterized protein (TIGR00251 family)